VLLGDVLELREAPLRDALAAASRVLRELATALPTGATVVIVPGNHDHYLTHGFNERRAAEGPPSALELETALDWKKREPLAALADLLEGAGITVEARYPGVWLRNDVYAMHGHFLDVHTKVPIFERLASGAMGRMLHITQERIETIEGYERLLSPLYAWIYAVAQQQDSAAPEPQASASMKVWNTLQNGRGIRRHGLAAALSVATRAITRFGKIGALRSDVSLPQMRRDELEAFGTALTQLQIHSSYVIFGHTHRAGPLSGDDLSEWIAPNRTRMLNSGSWVRETDFMGADQKHSAFRPGFAVELDDDGPPRLINLLDS
jgi:hypothetical protein